MCIGSGKSELPVRKTEAMREIFADPFSIFRGKHEGDALLRLACNGLDCWRGRVAGHRAGVAKAKIDVIAAVNIGEMRSVGFCDEDGKFASPFFHPVHGDAAEEGSLGAFVKGRRFRVVGYEFLFLAGHESREVSSIDRVFSKPIFGSAHGSPCNLFPEVAEDFAGGVGAGGTGDTVAGVGAVAAEVEASYRGGVTGPAKNGAHGENLVEGKFTVEWVASG